MADRSFRPPLALISGLVLPGLSGRHHPDIVPAHCTERNERGT